MNTLFNKGALRSIFFAILAVIVLSGLLSWQYNLIAKKSQEKLSSLEDLVEQSFAQDVLDKFMAARQAKNNSQASLFLTERAMAQKEGNDFDLFLDFENYFISSSSKVSSDPPSETEKYQFLIKLYGKGGEEALETITVTKILDKYYIDSVNTAG